MANYSVLDIAKYFMNSGKFFSNKKLQKVVYYAYSWYLVRKNSNSKNIRNRLFESNIEAWVHGPVCPDLYHSFNRNEIRNYNAKTIDTDTKKILDIVLDIYGDYSGDELEKFTHQESPWINARKGYSSCERCSNDIKDQDIYEFYSKKIR